MGHIIKLNRLPIVVFSKNRLKNKHYKNYVDKMYRHMFIINL